MHTYMHDSRAPVTADTSQSDHVSAVQGKMHFSELMTGMINLDDAPNSIKLVGPSINCEGTVRLPGGLQRSNPHVQSFAVATDQTGAPPLRMMNLCLDAGPVVQPPCVGRTAAESQGAPCRHQAADRRRQRVWVLLQHRRDHLPLGTGLLRRHPARRLQPGLLHGAPLPRVPLCWAGASCLRWLHSSRLVLLLEQRADALRVACRAGTRA